MFDPDEYQDLLNARDELDDGPVRLSRHQAHKCAAIITAGHDGHHAYAEASDIVAQYLHALALETLAATSRAPASSATLWKILDDLPWPAPGHPAQQPT